MSADLMLMACSVRGWVVHIRDKTAVRRQMIPSIVNKAAEF